MPDSMDWVKDGMRRCDVCGYETDAGAWPDWTNGMCEDCDPDILENYFDCDDCGVTHSLDYVKKMSDEKYQTALLCSVCYMERMEKANA